MVASLTLASRVARSINMKVINVILLLCCLCGWQVARAGTCDDRAAAVDAVGGNN